MAKKAINEGTEVADMTSALAIEGECYEQLLHTQDRLEALAAFAEKRKPVYSRKVVSERMMIIVLRSSSPNMLGLRRLLAVSGRPRAGRSPPPSAASSHSAVFFRALQILAQPGPVRLQKLSAPDTGIVELRLERPEAKNAIGKEMLQGLRSAIQEVEADTAANVVLVASSVPKVFCAGADLKGIRSSVR
ncbi:probable enoyl-CoA hydratase 2, mitochondrial [Miscanthus floridulus]|uniref:probable enoyl-CoA hydratase 2, mitochondrial n=1 Tax=Miscanthus floridulus TaxID=154761 RepID=UPI0034577FDF